MQTELPYPDILRPRLYERVTLPSGCSVDVPKATIIFQKWLLEVPSKTYGNKALLACDHELVFAELAILRIFERAGWDGRWIDSFGGKFRIGYWTDDATRDLPPEQRAVFDSIQKLAGIKGGCFDVLCWRDGIVCFAEAKRKKRDRIRRTQKRWLEAALSFGLPVTAFLIVEWDTV
jgi:hypothetical protein